MVIADVQKETVNGACLVGGLIGYRLELRLVVNRQIGAHGQVLPNHPGDVFAAATLARTVRVADVDFDARVGVQLRMACDFLALVVHQYLTPLRGNAAQIRRKAFQSRSVQAERCRVREMLFAAQSWLLITMIVARFSAVSCS